MAYIEFYTKKGLEVAFAKKDLELDGRKLQLSLMGPLVKASTIKRAFESESSNPKSLSPAKKRLKKQFQKSKKGKYYISRFGKHFSNAEYFCYSYKCSVI